MAMSSRHGVSVYTRNFREDSRCAPNLYSSGKFSVKVGDENLEEHGESPDDIVRPLDFSVIRYPEWFETLPERRPCSVSMIIVQL